MKCHSMTWWMNYKLTLSKRNSSISIKVYQNLKLKKNQKVIWENKIIIEITKCLFSI